MRLLFLTEIKIDRENIIDDSRYPFNIECIKNIEKITFNKPVTFLTGENGVGKSTFIEALAVSLGLNAEGGTNNFNFSTQDTHSELYKYMRLYKTDVPKTKFFLRAESFYNVASEIRTLYKGDYYNLVRSYGGDLHNCSHGESFIQLIQNRFSDHGLYILDEPEAALSVNRQLSLLCMIDELVKQGSQFIIATHSPILTAYREGEILDLNRNFCQINYKETDIYQIYRLFLDDPYMMQRRLFDDDLK